MCYTVCLYEGNPVSLSRDFLFATHSTHKSMYVIVNLLEILLGRKTPFTTQLSMLNAAPPQTVD